MMRAAAFFFVFAFTMPAFAAPKALKHRINWNKESSLSVILFQNCKAKKYDSVDIEIPGTPQKSFAVRVETDVTDGEVGHSGCALKRTVYAEGAVYSFDVTGERCIVKVHRRGGLGGPKGEADIHIAKNCDD